MKIQAIRIQNLASLDGNTEIDFTQEPLCSAGIFAITGPTGAGKSTILDALCLALYARTPRYRLAENGIDITDITGSTIKQDDVRGILRDGTSGGYAEVDFEGVDGQYYRATWSVRRARHKADGNLQPYEMSLKNITTHQDIPGKKTELLPEIERLVGLNFEQFTRSVLLAQGDFTAFLKAGKDEKSSLLEKLTGTSVYSEISIKVFEHQREEQQKLRELHVQREGIATLTTEELSALQKQRQALKIAIATDEKQIAELNKEVSWHEQLLKLQDGVQAATIQHDQATSAKTEAQSREQQFQQVMRIQPARPVVSSLQSAGEQITARSNEVEELAANLNALKEQQKLSNAALEQATTALKTKEQEEDQAKPLLNTGKALDVQLAEKAEQLKQATNDVAVVRKKETAQKEEAARVEKALDAVEKEIERLRQWKAENESRRPIAEQESLILSKLEDAADILEKLRNCTDRIHAADEDSKKLQQEQQILEGQRTAIQSSRQQKQSDCQSLQTALSGISLQDMEKEKSSLDHSIEDLVAAAAHWQLLAHAIAEKGTLLQSLKQTKEELAQNTAQLAATEKLLEATKSARSASLKMLEKARMAATESVTRLRHQLEPEAPCPVCGSTDHPYATRHPELDHVLSELESAHAQNEAAYTQQLTAHTRLNQSCTTSGKIIGELEDKIAHNEASVKGLESNWSDFRVAEKCNAQPLEERTAWLQTQLQQQKAQQQRLQGQIQAYQKQKEQLEDHQTQLAALEKQLNEAENQLKDTERALKTLREQQKKDTAEQEQIRKNLDDITQNLAVYFASEKWLENWQSAPEPFVTHIREFARDWKANTTRLDEHMHQQSILAEKRKGIQEQIKSTREAVQVSEQKLLKLQDLHKALSDQRRTLFNGDPVTAVEARLRESVHVAKQALEEQRKTADKIQGDITRSQAQQEQLEKDIRALSQQESALKEQFSVWLTGHNRQHGTALTQEDLLSLLAFTQDWIEKERAALRAIDDAVMQATSILEERTKAWTAHAEQRPSERTPEALNALRTEAQDLLKQHMQQTHEIDFKLREDALHKQRIGTLLQDIEKQAAIFENWAKLNELIGSADGKKFRQIAQEYTLDVLLSYANVHLEVLSKRYVLQRIPDSLGLQVIDLDMGDEVRTVYSLSGGESFLVSLALALGLASLSSSRMKVESLFIDEGFGSLDPATLNIAMDALERLHNQGRKVGVISHVQEMTERIPVQIKVSKQQGGRSKVEVVEI
ncbi:AAA family ATPase [Compostibacter hankyongensis]|uniref:AAA family ATPase n=1 Tax=Compostibacter hankyongensis TaxID=1007089 RepID=A0ABP8FQQ9_9BACT